jgi:hypothetical protein
VNLAMYLALVVILWMTFYVHVMLASVVSAKSENAYVFGGSYGVSVTYFSQETENRPIARKR